MNKLITTSVFILVLSANAYADNSRHVQSVQYNMDACYEQTQIKQNPRLRACNQIVQSDVVSPQKKAIALHNRAVIRFNQGEFQLALKDFLRAAKRAPNQTESLLAAKYLQQGETAEMIAALNNKDAQSQTK